MQSPLALVSSAPEVRVLPALEASGLLPRFDAVVTGDDVYRGSPDPEGFLYAAQKIARPPLRCVVIGSSNQSIEAAHEVRAAHALRVHVRVLQQPAPAGRRASAGIRCRPAHPRADHPPSSPPPTLPPMQVGMKCVALAGRQPVYELSAADLVVRDLVRPL